MKIGKLRPIKMYKASVYAELEWFRFCRHAKHLHLQFESVEMQLT